MTSSAKRKGTAGETELMRLFNRAGFRLVRTAPALPYDLEQHPTGRLAEREPLCPIEALIVRPDRGQWLVALRLAQFFELLAAYEAVHEGRAPLHIESKRYARFSLHRIFESKFGREA